jgi:hypothetical protein
MAWDRNLTKAIVLLLDCFCAIVAPSAVEDRVDFKIPAVLQGSSVLQKRVQAQVLECLAKPDPGVEYTG